MYFEVFEAVRRITLVSVLGFLSDSESIAGFFLCVVSLTIQRETCPYLENGANVLSVWASYAVAMVSLACVLTASRPNYYGIGTGWLLSVVVVSVPLLSIALHFGMLNMYEKQWLRRRRRSS